MPPEHYKVVYDILNCRSAYLGGRIERCDHCNSERVVYNSCRNRHCPKCQTITKERWLRAREAELLPVKYFHNVFTLPHTLNPLILCNKKVMLGFLFKAATETLILFGHNPENGLGGKLGIVAILHTWTQTLMDHFHLHCLVPGGALSEDGAEWFDCNDQFLFPVKALSKVFRGKFISYLEDAFEKNQLKFPGNTNGLKSPKGFRKLVNQLWSKNWVVYTKESDQSPRVGAGLSWPLYPPYCHIEPSHMRFFKRSGDIHRQKQEAKNNRDGHPGCCRVYPPVPSACGSQTICSNPTLRIFGKSVQEKEHFNLPDSTGVETGGSDGGQKNVD